MNKEIEMISEIYREFLMGVGGAGLTHQSKIAFLKGG